MDGEPQPRAETPKGEAFPRTRNLSVTRAVADGYTPECRSLKIVPSGDFAGTIAGTAYTGADGGFDMLAPEDDRIGGTPYTITAGSLLIFALS